MAKPCFFHFLVFSLVFLTSFTFVLRWIPQKTRNKPVLDPRFAPPPHAPRPSAVAGLPELSVADAVVLTARADQAGGGGNGGNSFFFFNHGNFMYFFSFFLIYVICFFKSFLFV